MSVSWLNIMGLVVAAFGVVGRFWLKHESQVLDRKYGTGRE